MVPDQLQAERQPVHFPAGYGDRGDPGEAHRSGVDIDKIHLERIFDPLSQLEGRGGHGGSEYHIDLLECPIEILLNQRPHPLGLAIPLFVVSR